jgi:hypothetical protein
MDIVGGTGAQLISEFDVVCIVFINKTVYVENI